MIEINELPQTPAEAKKAPCGWKKLAKSLAILTACVGIGAGVGYGLSAVQKAQWQSVAQFEAPKVADLGNYYQLASTYALLQGATGENVAMNIREQSFAEFKRTVTSPDAIKQFLNQSDSVKILAQANKQPVEKAVGELVEKFQFNDKFNRLSLTLDNAETANQLLNEFVAFATKQSRSVLNGELVGKWKVLFQQVKSAAESDLGAIQLGNQVAQQDWKGKLSLMKSVQPLDDKLVAYRVIESPSTPTQPHSPNKWLWLMIGAVGGLVLGLFSLSATNSRRA